MNKPELTSSEQLSTEEIEKQLQKGLCVAAEKSCIQLIENNPADFHALQLLGIALLQQNKLSQAISFFQKALKLNKWHAPTNNNLGYVYIQTGEFKKAVKVLRRAIKIEPDSAEICNSLAASLYGLRSYFEAEKYYKQAITLNPKFTEAIDNLGLCLKKQGRLAESIEKHLQAINATPDSPRAYIHLLQSMTLSHKYDVALTIASAGLEITNSDTAEYHHLLISMARIAWFLGQYELAKEVLNQSNSIGSSKFDNYASIQTIRAYHTYLSQLLTIPYPSETPEKTIFFIGDSHCLSASGKQVEYQRQLFTIFSILIVGCKAWHLGRKRGNEFKTSLELTLQSLPPDSTVILGMGEIDCRANEGFLKAHKTGGKNYETIIPEVVQRYISFVTHLGNKYSHTIIFYGVAMLSNRLADALSQSDKKHLLHIIHLFNTELIHQCNNAGYKVLDVYTATQSGTNSYYLDKRHLHPNILPILFSEYLVG